MTRVRKASPNSLPSWFERHAGATFVFLASLFILLCLAGTEKLLQTGTDATGRQRFINLREHRPLFADLIYPTEADQEHAQDLERKKYRLRVDGDGYIIPSRNHPQADVTLVFLGGSTTECLYMEEEERFPAQVGRLAAQALQLRVNSLNSGKAGNNSLHSLNILLNKVVPLKPDLVIMMHNINDLIILLFEHSYWNTNRMKAPLVEVKTSLGTSLNQAGASLRDYWIPNLSRAVGDVSTRFLQRSRPTEFQAVRGQPVAIQTSRLLQDFRANLQLFVDICRTWEMVPVFMTQANRFTPEPDAFIASRVQRLEVQHAITYKDFKEIFDLFNEEIRQVGRENQVPVIDLARDIPPERRYIYDTVHLSAAGSVLASQVIWRQLEPVLPGILAKKRPQAG